MILIDFKKPDFVLYPGHNWVVTIKSQIFLLRKFGVIWVYIDLPGVVIWPHIYPSTHASYILRRRLTRFQLLRPENSSDILEWGPGVIHTGNITLIAPNHLQARIGYLQVPIAGNHRLSLLVHLSSLHHHSLIHQVVISAEEDVGFRCF